MFIAVTKKKTLTMAGMAQHNNVLKTCIVKCTNLLVISIVLNYSSSPKHDFHICIQ